MGPSLPEPRLPEVGEVVGKYRVTSVLGEGGMGVVYEAVHERLKQSVAIKVLRPFVARVTEQRARFEREARAAGQLQGSHVARVLDVETTTTGLPCLVMERLTGRDLSVELRERKKLPVEEAVTYVLQACAAMDEAHALGIVHRDLKPSNLFLEDFGGRKGVKVLDFGISKIEAEESNLTQALTAVGSPLYMSPEQVRCAKEVGAQTDVWSLGVILYELLAGRPPWEGTRTAAVAAIVTDPPPKLRELAPEVPEVLEQVVLGALEKALGLRFRDVRAFAAALAPFAPDTASRWLTSPPSSRRVPLQAPPPSSLDSLRAVPTLAETKLGPQMPTTDAWTTGSLRPPAPASPSTPPPTRRRALFAAVLGGVLAVGAAVVWVAVRMSSGAAPVQVLAAPPPPAVDVNDVVATPTVATKAPPVVGNSAPTPSPSDAAKRKGRPPVPPPAKPAPPTAPAPAPSPGTNPLHL